MEKDRLDATWNSNHGLSSWLMESCQELGIKELRPVQYNTIPHVLKGRDIIASAPTGTGKTAAFALPIIQRLSEDPFGVFALILTPTRELAFQLCDQFNVFGAKIGIRTLVLVGGRDMLLQGLALDTKPHIIIATPGRLLDHLQSNSDLAKSLSKLRYLVLDEADRLVLNDGLSQSVSKVMAFLPTGPKKRYQLLLFSATMTNDALSRFSSLPLNDPFTYTVGPTFDVVSGLKQEYLFMPEKVKDCYLVHLLRTQIMVEEDTKAIIFTAKCFTAQLIHEMLTELEIPSVPLHSDLSQHQRLKSLELFKAGTVKVLVATDVASRGLDIQTVELVINFDIPKMVDDYIHRIGRTARAGRGGRAVSLITQFDVDKLHNIELEEFRVDEEEVLKHANETSVAKALATHRLEKIEFGQKKKRRNRETDDKQGTTKRKVKKLRKPS